MEVLTRFSEKEKAYHLYKARENVLRDEATKKHLLEKTELQLEKTEYQLKNERQQKEVERQQKEVERQQKEVERQQKEEAIMKNERLIAMLEAAGIDPDQAEK